MPCFHSLLRLLRVFAFLAPLFATFLQPVRADDSLFVVTGVPVDVKAANATAARKQAFGDVQVTAFRMLAERLGGPAAGQQAAGYDIKTVGRLLRSLSVEEEHTGPGRYFGKLTVRFLPGKVRKVFTEAGISWSESRSGRIVIVPLWKGEDGTILWQDNPWRQAWLDLGAENALVPLLVPLGDLSDSQTLSVEDAINGDAAKLEEIRNRYQGEAILVAVGTPAGENSVHARMEGRTPIGSVLFDKTYSVDAGGVAAAAASAVRRFHAVLSEKWRASRDAAQVQSVAVQTLAVAVPFGSLDEWNSIRDGLLSTPGVTGADISNLAQGGATVRLGYTVPFAALQANLYQRRLSLQQATGGWLLRPF